MPNALEDERFHDNPLVTGEPKIRFYAGAPLRSPGGEMIGTLCIIDRRPREFNADDLALLRDLADCVEQELAQTQLVQLTEAYREDKQRLSHLIKVSPGVIYSCRAGDDFVITYVDEKVEYMLGYPARRFTEDTSFWFNLISPDDQQRVKESLSDLSETGHQSLEYRVRHADGGYRWILDQQKLIQHNGSGQGEIVGLWMDISDRKHDEDLLKSAESRIRAIVDNVIDGIISIDARGIIKTVNPAAEHLFGYKAEEMLEKNVKMLMPEPYQIAHDQYIQNYLVTGERKVIGIGREVTGLRKDGSTFPMELAIGEMTVDGEKMFTGIVRDITERKKVERLKSEFISTVSHELRTPLTSIRGALNLVLGKAADQLEPKPRRMLEMAERNSERLTLLINDILDLEKIESGRLAFEFQRVDLIELLQRACEDNDAYARSHHVQLQLNPSMEAAPILGDAHRLLQVLANLISNAVKFSPQGSEVTVAATASGQYYRLSVTDQGPGIPEEFHQRIFQRFAQADSSDSREKGGTGLGLSITKAIAEHHGGQVGFESEPGQGSMFYVDLPVWEETRLAENQATGRGRVLVCEDNADIAHILVDLLQREKLVADIASTAAAASQLLMVQSYDLLLLDLSLPDADGLQLLQALRRDPRTSSLPVIIVSGRAEEGRSSFSGDALMVVDWLQKPLDRRRLRHALEEALQRSAQPHILHIEDDADIVQVVAAMLEDVADLTAVDSLAEAHERLQNGQFDLVILDLNLADGSGVELLDELKGRCPVVIFSALEPSRDVSQQVAAALTKSRTSNQQLLATIKNLLST